MTDHGQQHDGETLRAAQIQAVRDVMGVGRQLDDLTERAVADTAAVLAAGSRIPADQVGAYADEQSETDAQPFEALRTTGLLWLINRVTFHPRGYALALVRRGGQITGWKLLGDGTEVWRFEGDEDQHFERVRDYLEAVGPGTGETVQARGGVVQGAPLVDEPGPPSFLWPNIHVVDGLPDGRILFVTPRTDECAKGCDHVHAIAYDTGTGPLSNPGPAEQYPGQYTTPKNGCPVCGGPIQVAQIDTGTKPYHDFIPGRWDCPRGCDPRQAVTEDADG